MENPFAIIVVARDREGGIGKAGDLPWHLPGDLSFFQNITRGTGSQRGKNAVVMGRKTWESIPTRYRPLAERFNVVVTRQEGYQVPEGVGLAHSLREGLEIAREAVGSGNVFLVGGGTLYKEALETDLIKTAWITEIDSRFDCDTFFPSLSAAFRVAERGGVQTENGTDYRFVRYEWAGKAV